MMEPAPGAAPDELPGAGSVPPTRFDELPGAGSVSPTRFDQATANQATPADIDPERLARAAWSRLCEPGDPTAAGLVAQLGAVDALDKLSAYRGTRKPLLRYLPRLQALDVDRDLRVAGRLGARVVIPTDQEWPSGLNDLDCPPMCLWVRGPLSLAQACRRSVAVVGARAATAYGVMLAADIAAGLQRRGFTVMSGAAFGIDAAAHRGALSDDGTTIAVLAGGVDQPYPAAHAGLIAEIIGVGAVLSEAPPTSRPSRLRFLQRNRLIAAMSSGTLVVEAGLRSGSLSTLNHAVSIGRPTAAVPGPVTSMMSAGTHQAVRDGKAVLVTDAAEVADLMGELGSDAAEPRRGPEVVEDNLSEVCLRVLAVLPRSGAMVPGAVAAAAGLTVSETIGHLGQLELAGHVRRREGGWSRVRG